ncbi:unnamed protein product [Hermetia illucens]|uniref:Uncharacterized protein n=1 Tax=Hermetia illucens TaxID=343691 RepID=A0A7R8YVU9_HERIL|nr:unnamed protein product [Hermetia illucens]
MDQYTRKTQRTRVFNPAPKAPIAVATGGIPPKPCTGLKRKFDEALDAKLEEYLARKAGSKKPKFDDKVQQLISKANAGNVRVGQSCVKTGNSSTFAAVMNGVSKKIDYPQKQLTNSKVSGNANSSASDVPHMPQKASNNLLSNCKDSNRGGEGISRKVDRSTASMKGQGALRKEQARCNAHNSSKKEEGAGRGKHAPALHGANHVTNNRDVDKRAEQESSKSRHNSAENRNSSTKHKTSNEQRGKRESPVRSSDHVTKNKGVDKNRHHSSENRHSSTKHKTSTERESMKKSIIKESRSQKTKKDNDASQQKSSHSDVTERKRPHSEFNSSAKKNSFASALGDISRKVDQIKESTKCQDPSRKEKSSHHHSVKKEQDGFANALENISRKTDRLKTSTRCHGDSSEKKAEVDQGKQDRRRQTAATDGDSSSARIATQTKANSSRRRSSDSDPPPSDKNKMSHDLPSQGNRPDSFGATLNGSSKMSSETSSNEESMPKSPRKVIVIDIPTAVSQKRIIIKGNHTAQQGKMAAAPKNEKAEKKECVKPVKTKPTKSLRERLASKGKFTFSTANHSNPVRKNMAIIKERLAQLTQNKKAAEVVARDQENNIIGKNQEALNNNHITANKGEQTQLKDEPHRLREELPQPVENKGYPSERNVEVVSSVTSTVMDKLHVSNEESSLLPGSEDSSSSGSDESSSSDSGDSSSEDDSASSDDDSDSSSSEDEEEYDNNEKLGQMLEEKLGSCPNDDEVFRGQLATNELFQDLDLSCSFSEEEI